MSESARSYKENNEQDLQALISHIQTYDETVNKELVTQAYRLCKKAHQGQIRKSGEPYYTHPLAVAEILTELRLDYASICTALLHDTIEDTDVTFQNIENKFGLEIAKLVDGVTKLSQLELNSKKTAQAENLQKFITAISKDVRVLLIKLADRLHNMRTLSHISNSQKKEKKSRETLEIYAPLARKIGIHRFSSELEDLSFRYLNSSAYESIVTRLNTLKLQRTDSVALVSESIAKTLEETGIQARVFGREKKPYSIWRKLERMAIDFSDLADIYAFRVIVETIPQCYQVLGIAHTVWRCLPSRFKDYISTPKLNGYRSLHTTILGPDNLRVELQIRTESMDQIAENGVAAHWRYKNKSYVYDTELAKEAGSSDFFEKLRPLFEILEHGGDPDEFLEHAKLEMFSDQVFAFTPKGDIIPLPMGATPLDFAYAVHTQIGDTCIGAKINGKKKPLRTRLENGDVVAIIRSANASLNLNWENIVVTGKARSAIKRLIRRSEREEFERIGKLIANRAFKRNNKNLDSSDLTDALFRLGYKEENSLYEDLGKGRLSGEELLDSVFPARKKMENKEERHLINNKTAWLFVDGQGLTPGITLHFSECCYPLPGDRIIGLLKRDIGVEIHSIDCETLAQYEKNQNIWLDLGWTSEAEKHSVSIGQIKITIEHVPGVLAQISTLVYENKANITNIKFENRTSDFFDIELDVEVENAKHLSQIITALRACGSVISAQRSRNLY